MLPGAYVLLVNGTFIWPVTFSSSSIVYYRLNLFVRETPAEPSRSYIMLKYCVISCTRCCFSGLMTFCLLHTIHIIFLLPPSVHFFLSVRIYVCLSFSRHR